jgi:hypothetical protein
MKYATPETIKELETMFELSKPEQLREHLNFVFFQWLWHLKNDGMPDNIDEISEDIYFLISFLEQAQKNRRK